MLWFIFAVIAALSHAARAAFSKKILQNVDEYLVAWATSFFALPFFILMLFFVKIPKIDNTFWIALIFVLIFNTVAAILYMKSIKVSPLSLTVPFLTFTPLFLLLTSPVILGESPGLAGTIGVILIVFGAYVLNIQTLHKGFLAPFKAIIKEKGSLFMLIVAFIYAIGSNIDKIAVMSSSPLFYAIVFHSGLSIVFLPIIMLKSKDKLRKIKMNLKSFFIIGFLLAVMFISQMIAIKLTLVSYVISVKRTSAIFSVILGFLFFKEKNFKQCLLGAIIMVIGVMLITLF